MPKSTFYHLSQKRKEEIIRVCFEEFAKQDYKAASVSRIVEKLGIAKGSFYRYFESKRELYQFLIDQAMALQMEQVKDLFELPPGNFFALFEQHLAMKIRFDLDYPLQSIFLHNSMQEQNRDESGDARMRSKEMMIELLTPFIEKQKQKGVIRSDIQSELIAFSILQVQLGISDLLTILPHTEQDIQTTIKAFSSLLANGLAKK